MEVNRSTAAIVFDCPFRRRAACHAVGEIFRRGPPRCRAGHRPPRTLQCGPHRVPRDAL